MLSQPSSSIELVCNDLDCEGPRRVCDNETTEPQIFYPPEHVKGKDTFMIYNDHVIFVAAPFPYTNGTPFFLDDSSELNIRSFLLQMLILVVNWSTATSEHDGSSSEVHLASASPLSLGYRIQAHLH